MIVDIKKSLRLTFYFWFQEKKKLKTFGRHYNKKVYIILP